MKILVTGGSGFIGSNYIHYVLQHHPDYSVINLDKITYAGNLENLKDIETNSNYKFIWGDIKDKTLVRVLVRSCDAVVHFAAESHVDRSITGPVEFIQTNVVGTQVLLDACVEYKKRFHHISTDEVFGSLPLNSADKFTEDTKYAPSSPYSASKAASDHLVRAYHQTYGLDITITNCGNNYGPYQYPEKLIPLMITNAIEGKKLPVYGKGNNVRDWIHVWDHCAAIDLILHKGKIGETYLVSGDSERTNLEVIHGILKILKLDKKMISFVEDRKGHDLRYAIDSSKIERELGWTRKFSFELGLSQTVGWYLVNSEWWGRLRRK